MKLEKKQFAESGRFFKEVITKTTSGMNEAVDADGGAAVGTYLSDMVFDQLQYQGTFWSDVAKVEATRGPVVKIRSRVNSLMTEPTTGVRSYWVAEGDASTASNVRCNAVEVNLAKLVTRVPVTGELNEDVASLGQIILEDTTQSMIYTIESAIINGSTTVQSVMDVTNCAGAIVSNCASEIPSEAELISASDKLHPMAKVAKWYFSKKIFSSILKINFTTPNALNFEDGQYWLFGMPMVIAPQLTAAPKAWILADFTKYGVGYIAPKFTTSEGVRFLEDEKELRLQIRLGGNSYVETSDLDDGSTYGWFIVPDTPAAE